MFFFSKKQTIHPRFRFNRATIGVVYTQDTPKGLPETPPLRVGLICLMAIVNLPPPFPNTPPSREIAGLMIFFSVLGLNPLVISPVIFDIFFSLIETSNLSERGILGEPLGVRGIGWPVIKLIGWGKSFLMTWKPWISKRLRSMGKKLVNKNR